MSAGSDKSSLMPSFDQDALRIAAEKHFSCTCTKMEKIAEGGFHKVFLLQLDGIADVIARVAKPAVPRDKMESEVATLRYLTAFTSVPVPAVYSWCSNPENPIGAEYMFMEKASGVDASNAWEGLDLLLKLVFVRDLAVYLSQIFKLRFTRAGSLYLTESGRLDSTNISSFMLGPILTAPFYMTEGRSPVSTPTSRGPYDTVFDFLSSFPKAELAYLEEHHEEAVQSLIDTWKRSFPYGDPNDFTRDAVEEKYNVALKAVRKQLEVCQIYGALPITTPNPDPVFSATEFVLYLDDLRLSNFTLDPFTGHLTAFIDVEGAITAPLWHVPSLPSWLSSHSKWGDGRDDDESRNPSPEKKEAYEQSILRKAFLAQMDELDSVPMEHPSTLSGIQPISSFQSSPGWNVGQWRRALEQGAAMRRTSSCLAVGWPLVFGKYFVNLADLLLEWAKENRGVIDDDESATIRARRASGLKGDSDWEIRYPDPVDTDEDTDDSE